MMKVAIELHHHHWVAYNSAVYFINCDEVLFFKHKEEADEFCMNNISEFDIFQTIEAATLAEAVQQIKLGECYDCSVGREERNRGDMDDLDMSRGKGHRL